MSIVYAKYNSITYHCVVSVILLTNNASGQMAIGHVRHTGCSLKVIVKVNPIDVHAEIKHKRLILHCNVTVTTYNTFKRKVSMAAPEYRSS